MNRDEIQKLKLQLNEIRGSYYRGAQKTLDVDITGIPLPRGDVTVSGGFEAKPDKGAEYEYMEPTEYDRQQQAASTAQPEEKPNPRLHQAMGTFLYRAVSYLEARQEMADGEIISGMLTRERNLAEALREVKQAALLPPFPEAKKFYEDVSRMADVGFMLATSDHAITREVAEMKLEESQSARR